VDLLEIVVFAVDESVLRKAGLLRVETLLAVTAPQTAQMPHAVHDEQVVAVLDLAQTATALRHRLHGVGGLLWHATRLQLLL